MQQDPSASSSWGAAARDALAAALPIMLGYISIGLPCGVMENAVGISPVLAFAISATLYSGAGQFMYCNMWLAGTPLASIIASIAFVNTRQMLYSAAFAPYFAGVRKRVTALFSATVTDESFGVNMARYKAPEPWDARRATLVNLFSMFTWATANMVGCLVGTVVDVPVALASFAMTAIFICLLVLQEATPTNIVVALVAFVAVFALKCVGLGGPAILLGASVAVVVGLVVSGRGGPWSR